MQTLAMVLWTATILLEVKGQEDEVWDPWTDNCESMVPCNLTEPQTDTMPYIVTLNRPYINSDQAVYVYIRALPPLSFQGFMIQARDDKTGQAVGEFDTDNRKGFIIQAQDDKSGQTFGEIETDNRNISIIRYSPCQMYVL
ncbi:hypothetical protein J6590_095836 [Homalodisca vitripennis]|nr:hypothetical protein J6590_095836 [Homalodisca vitripennis]